MRTPTCRPTTRSAGSGTWDSGRVSKYKTIVPQGPRGFATRPFFCFLLFLMTEPNSAAEALVGDALGSLNAGRPHDAEMLCRRALTLQPGHLGALALLGVVLHEARRFGEAEQVFQELT